MDGPCRPSGSNSNEAMTSSSCLPRPVTRCNTIQRSGREPYVHMYMRPAFSSPSVISPAERSASAHGSPAAGCAYGCAHVCFPAVCQCPAKRVVFIAPYLARFGMAHQLDAACTYVYGTCRCFSDAGADKPRLARLTYGSDVSMGLRTDSAGICICMHGRRRDVDS